MESYDDGGSAFDDGAEVEGQEPGPAFEPSHEFDYAADQQPAPAYDEALTRQVAEEQHALQQQHLAEQQHHQQATAIIEGYVLDEAEALVERYPELAQEPIAKALMHEARQEAERLGEPDLANAPQFWREVYERSGLSIEHAGGVGRKALPF